MICLTSDIHHMSLNTGNQQHADRTEIEIADMFAGLLARYGLQSTYFITGKSFEEEWNGLKDICRNPDIEIGGHTYHCFEPQLWHRGWNKLIGSYNGPRWYQNWDIEKTKNIILAKSGRRIKSWRNHMYMHGPFTEELLAQNDISVCCDHVRRQGPLFDIHETGIVNFPINIIPDHEHLYHAERTPEWVEKWISRYNWADDYGSSSYYFDDWFKIFQEGVVSRESSNQVSHILIHPITIYLCGGTKALNDVVSFLAEFDSTQVSNLVATLNEYSSSLASN